MSVPGLWTATRLVRRPSRSPLGRRWRDLARQPRAALPATSPRDPLRLRRRDDRRSTAVLPAGRNDARGSRTASDLTGGRALVLTGQDLLGPMARSLRPDARGTRLADDLDL